MSILDALSMGTIKNFEVTFGDLMMIGIKHKGFPSSKNCQCKEKTQSTQLHTIEKK